MNTDNIISKKLLKESYEEYSEYFSEITLNIVKYLQEKIHLLTKPTYKWRIKSFSSYYKKVLRLKSTQLENCNSFIYLTDMMGIRLVCPFLEDINIAVEQIKKAFDVKEVEVKGADKSFSEFGYESVHVLVSIPDCLKPQLIGKYQNLKPISNEIVCEIQVRTILQDAWAEVEHELIYKTEFNPFDKPLRRKLASINASLSLADITFQEIRDYQNKLQREVAERKKSFYKIAEEFLDEEILVDKTDQMIPDSQYVQGTIDDLLLRGIAAHNEGRLEEAVLIYTKIIESIPSNDKNIIAVICKHRGMAHFAMNKFEDAIQDFQTSIDADPKNFRSYYYKGIVYSIQKKYQQAIDCYTKSLEINQFQSHTTYRRAMAYFEIQEYEKSMHDLDVSIKLGMKDNEVKQLQEKLVKKFDMNM